MVKRITEEEFKTLVIKLKTVYSSFKEFIKDKPAFDTWYEAICDLKFSWLSESVREYIAKGQYPPTPADLRNGCEPYIQMEHEYIDALYNIFDEIVRYYPDGFKNTDAAMTEYKAILKTERILSKKVDLANKLYTVVRTYVDNLTEGSKIPDLPLFIKEASKTL